MEKTRLEKQFDFCREIDKEKFIGRQTYLSDGKRKENDAEHAWHMAIMAILLNEYANEEIDVLKTVTMLLIHDLVEIDAGDTYAIDQAMIQADGTKDKSNLGANAILAVSIAWANFASGVSHASNSSHNLRSFSC